VSLTDLTPPRMHSGGFCAPRAAEVSFSASCQQRLKSHITPLPEGGGVPVKDWPRMLSVPWREVLR